jgi:hypothetical protein
MAERTTKTSPAKRNIARSPASQAGSSNTVNTTSSLSTASHGRLAWKRVLTAHAIHVIVLVLLAVATGLICYHLGQNSYGMGNAAASSDLRTTAGVVQRVSRHVLLPSGEQPTVATVTDASKVRNQAFFASSASGDKVLIYAQAKKAYLYRPSIDRVIEVAPLAPNTATPSADSNTPAPQQ